MKIVIIGDGKVGHKLTTQLSEENYDVVLIDQNEGKLKEAVNKLDIFCITGNGADVDVQRQADVPHADLVIACASTDELNMLSCLLAKRLGARHTIARVRNPIYYRQIDLLKEDLHLSMAVNPERAAAILCVCINLIRIFAVLSYPVMPAVAEQMLARLNLKPADMPALKGFCIEKEIAALQPGHGFTVGDALFERISPERIQELKAKYGSEKK